MSVESSATQNPLVREITDIQLYKDELASGDYPPEKEADIRKALEERQNKLDGLVDESQNIAPLTDWEEYMNGPRSKNRPEITAGGAHGLVAGHIAVSEESKTSNTPHSKVSGFGD